jgi:uncharacterized membrane protein required for colicin V production
MPRGVVRVFIVVVGTGLTVWLAYRYWF